MIWNEFYLYVCSCIGWSCLAVVIDSEEVSILFTWRNRESNGNSDGASSCGALNHRCFNYSCILITTEKFKVLSHEFSCYNYGATENYFFHAARVMGPRGAPNICILLNYSMVEGRVDLTILSEASVVEKDCWTPADGGRYNNSIWNEWL